MRPVNRSVTRRLLSFGSPITPTGCGNKLLALFDVITAGLAPDLSRTIAPCPPLVQVPPLHGPPRPFTRMISPAFKSETPCAQASNDPKPITAHTTASAHKPNAMARCLAYSPARPAP